MPIYRKPSYKPHRLRATPPRVESLENRQLATATFNEVEPNGRAPTAIYVALDSDQTALMHGRLSSRADKDYFAFAAPRSTTLQLSIDTSAPVSAARVRVEAASGQAIVSTRTTTEFSIAAGDTCYITLLSQRDAVTRYSISLSEVSRQSTVDPRRIEVLKRGVNVPHWFWDLRGQDPSQTMWTYFTDADAANLKQLGIGYIRIPLQPKYFFDFSKPTRLKSIHLPALHHAIDVALQNGLGVIIAPIGKLQSAGVDPIMLNKAKAFYRLFAADLSSFDPSHVFIQLPGEPEGTPYEWQPAQEQLSQVVRAAAPRHTIIASTPLKFGYGDNDWGTPDAITQLTPVTDRNVIYGLHFYEPFFFTHQGASWAQLGYGYLHDVPYPSTPENAELAAQQIALETAGTGFEYLADYVRFFGQAQWNADALKARLNIAFNWTRSWGVPLIVDEFGVYAFSGANPNSRDAWIGDVRSAIESSGFGWSMWDFADDFGLLVGAPSARWLRFSTAVALGLIR